MNVNLTRKSYDTRDEFYTTAETAQRFLIMCKEKQFDNMVVYCNCDGPDSEIYKLLKQRFNYYGIKKLVATQYVIDGHGLKTTFDGIAETIEELNGDGDYQSSECEQLLEQCNVVITNPPFSKLNDFIPYVMQHEKDCLLIVNLMAMVYRNVLPYTLSGRFAFTSRFSGGGKFKRPNGDIATVLVSAISTMLDLESPFIWRGYTTQQLKDNGKFVHADGTQTLECKYVADIPIDYDGDIFVSMSPLLLPTIRRYFQVIRIATEGVRVNGKLRFFRAVIHRKSNVSPEEILTMIEHIRSRASRLFSPPTFKNLKT